VISGTDVDADRSGSTVAAPGEQDERDQLSGDAPRARILRAACRCFASRGYAGTTLADIEREAGYEPRTGGIYRHIGSKREMLDAVIAAELASNATEIVGAEAPAGTTLREALEQSARRGLAQLDRQADLMRIVLRDLDEVPDLAEVVRRRLVDEVYRDFANRLEAAHVLGVVAARDFAAVAVIAIGSLVDAKIKEHVMGVVPLGLDEERLVATWVDLLASYLAVASNGGGPA
jgi:AcrR family transcriptional regulator